MKNWTKYLSSIAFVVIGAVIAHYAIEAIENARGRQVTADAAIPDGN